MDTKESIQRLATYSSEIRKLTLKRLKEVPKGAFNWRLNNRAMSFAHIVQHLIDVDELFFSLVESDGKQFQWSLGSEEPHFVVKEHDYELMIQQLKKFEQQRHAVISAFESQRFNSEVITEENGEQTTFWWFIMRKVLEHEIYHRGQIAAYLKVLKGETF